MKKNQVDQLAFGTIIMANSDVKQRYFEMLAKKYNTTVDGITVISYGEDRIKDESLRTKILMKFVSEPNSMWVVMVWKGEPFLGTTTNVLYYDYVGQVVESLNLHLYRTPYISQLFPINTIIADTAYFKRLISARPNAGFIVLVSDNVNNLQEACQEYNRPYLFLNHPVDTDFDDQYVITVDTRNITGEIVSHLYELGHRKIAFIHGILPRQSAQERLDGYYQGLATVGLRLDEELVVEGNWREDTGYTATKQLLSLDSKPTAIIASNDHMAMGAIQAIQEAGLHIPQDISVVGYDDIATSVQLTPPLTTVRIPMTQLGRMAVEYMVDLLEGKSPSPRHQNLPSELVIRESTSSPPQ